MKIQLSTKKYFGLGQVPIGIGAIFKGWDISEEDYKNPQKLSVVDFRAMSPGCPHNCFHCFTDKMKKDLTLEEIQGVIDQIAEIGTHGIDYLGEGEPTVDPDFFSIIEYTAYKGIIPLIYTDAATKLRDRKFARRLKDLDASVSPKCDSLFDSQYQNWVVGDAKGRYFEMRNEAIKLLIDEGFNDVREDGATRLGFDMVVSSRNKHEVERTLRYCRDNNLFILFSWFLPSGRSGREDFDKRQLLSENEKQELRETVRRVDLEYGFKHPIYNNFATYPCVEFMQIFGDGRVSPCPGNETVVGNIRTNSIRELQQRIYQQFPKHNHQTFNGNCLYRPLIQIR